jgi:UDP-N-acetylglucosamine 1-carboxyvinyltransferase
MREMPAVQYVVEGGRTLHGTIRPSGNKNAALPIVAAALISENTVHLENVPHIRDIETLMELVRSVGASIEWTAPNSLRISAPHVTAKDLDPALCAKIRASILLAAPILARCGEITLPPPGGDVIGRRRLDTHFLALEQLGAKMTIENGLLRVTVKEFRGADVFLDEPSVTATENALVAACAASGKTVLRNAASEPHVQDLAMFLQALGAHIEGVGTNCITIHGGKPLGKSEVTHTIGPDHIEVGSFIGLAAVTDSELRIKDAGIGRRGWDSSASESCARRTVKISSCPQNSR